MFGDDTTRSKRGWLVVQVVDDDVEYLWWEAADHHGTYFLNWITVSRDFTGDFS